MKFKLDCLSWLRFQSMPHHLRGQQHKLWRNHSLHFQFRLLTPVALHPNGSTIKRNTSSLFFHLLFRNNCTTFLLTKIMFTPLDIGQNKRIIHLNFLHLILRVFGTCYVRSQNLSLEHCVSQKLRTTCNIQIR